MSVDNLTDYILPIGLLFLYFLLTSKQKKKKPSHEPVVHKTEAPSSRKPPSRPSQEPSSPLIARKELGSSIEHRKLESAVSSRQLSSALEADLSRQIVSERMQKYSQEETAVESTLRKRPSKAALLFQRQSMRQSMLIKEILTRPFD